MFLDPRLPGRHTFSFLRAAIAFGKGVPGRSAGTGFAAKEHCEIGIVRAHNVSFLCALRVETTARYNYASDRCSRLRSSRPTLTDGPLCRRPTEIFILDITRQMYFMTHLLFFYREIRRLENLTDFDRVAGFGRATLRPFHDFFF